MEILTFLCGKFWRKSAISYDAIFQDAQYNTQQRVCTTQCESVSVRQASLFMFSTVAKICLSISAEENLPLW